MVLRKYDKDLDDSQPLWRYMSFDQFVHILATRTLWLAPLSSMEDKREGEWIDVQVSPRTLPFRKVLSMQQHRRLFLAGSLLMRSPYHCGILMLQQIRG